MRDPRAVDLSDVTVLRPVAQRIGENLARKLFEKRGNHSEAHLTERELALAIATGAEAAIKVWEG